MIKHDVKEYFNYDPLSGNITRVKRLLMDKVSKEACNQKIGNTGYLIIKFQRKKYLAHRLAWYLYCGYWPTIVDHINGIKLDNKIQNLREVTKRENCNNKEHNRLGRLAGCYFHKSKKRWIARYKIKNKPHYIGSFMTELGAHVAYAKAIKELTSKEVK